MAKITLELPDEVAAQLEETLKRIDETTKAAQAMKPNIDVNGLMALITQTTSHVGLELKRRSLQGLDVDKQQIIIDGKLHNKVGRNDATYKTLEGEVTVTRNIYRPAKQQNAKTVDVIEARLGSLGDGWLPETATAMAELMAQLTSREAEKTVKSMKRLPYSRSSFERVAHAAGAHYIKVCDVVDARIIHEYKIPDEARSLSVSLDRVSVPMEEPRRREGRPPKGAAKKPVSVNWRMAFCGTVTVHDENGAGLYTRRYGRMPGSDGRELADSLAADVAALHERRPDLKICILTDGAVEMQTLLDSALAEKLPDVKNCKLVDFWHLIEKLSAAASVIYGEKEGRRIVRQWKLLLMNSRQAVGRILKQLRESNCVEMRRGDATPVSDAIRYLQNHGERMKYSEARALGLPVGSGHVEATCKSLVGQRMRRSGSRWKEETGQHIIDLRALHLSHCFHEAMPYTFASLKREVESAA
jgi:hypothetical protein